MKKTVHSESRAKSEDSVRNLDHMGGWMHKIRVMASKFDNPENEEDVKSIDWEEEDQDTKAMTLE
jgi:hypothetical protein